MNILVVPTIRKESILSFLSSWKNHEYFDKIIVIEDNHEKTMVLDGCDHYCWENIKEDLKENEWIISRRDSAIRSYGFLKAYQQGASCIFTLDDDCYPCTQSKFIEEHLYNLNSFPKWTESVTGTRTRGIPYVNKGSLNVAFSMGFWQGIPDFDSIQTLSKQNENITFPDSRVMPMGQYFPFCGMNFSFKREHACLAYFPLMKTFKRFDDIWFGIIAKKICDHLNLGIVVGKPHIFHSRASNVFENLVKEAPGIKYNEKFWEIIDEIKLTKSTPNECMFEVGDQLLKKDDYCAQLGSAIKIWTSYFTD